MLPAELVVVWTLYVLDAVAMLVTYSRLPPPELYNVSGSGLEGGLSRVLVFANFSAALVAIAILLVLFDRLSTSALRGAAFAGFVLCTPVFWPGVVSEANLDARPVNAIAAIGVLLALVLTVVLGRRGLSWSRARGDRLRIVVAVVATFVSIPWIAAELGFYLDGVPFLGWLYETGSYHPTSVPSITLAAVHHGHHHGMDGLLLLTTALLLSRVVPSIGARRLRVFLGAYLALDGGVRGRQHGERLLDGADLEARLDDVAGAGRARAEGDRGVGSGRAGRALLYALAARRPVS